MDQRQVTGVAILLGAGGLAYWLTRMNPGALYAPVDLTFGLGDLFSTDPDPSVDPIDSADYTGSSGSAATSTDYLAQLTKAEDPSGDPWAKNPYSTASGLFQFTKATWTGLGGDWGTDPSQAFGGLQPTPAEQYAMAQKLTTQNAGILTRLGAAVNNATLYTMHIFGAGTGPKVVQAVSSADDSTPLASLPGVGTKIAAINPALGSTVGSFLNYLTAKVG